MKSVVESKPVACTVADGFRSAAIALQTQAAIDAGAELPIAATLFEGA